MQPKSIFRILTTIMIATTAFVVLADETYTWVDEHGVRHYAVSPPVDHSYETVEPANTLEAAAAETTIAAPAIEGPEIIGQCAHFEQRLESFEAQLEARLDRGDDEQSLASERELLETYRENFRAHCHQ